MEREMGVTDTITNRIATYCTSGDMEMIQHKERCKVSEGHGPNAPADQSTCSLSSNLFHIGKVLEQASLTNLRSLYCKNLFDHITRDVEGRHF